MGSLIQITRQSRIARLEALLPTAPMVAPLMPTFSLGANLGRSAWEKATPPTPTLRVISIVSLSVLAKQVTHVLRTMACAALSLIPIVLVERGASGGSYGNDQGVCTYSAHGDDEVGAVVV